MTGEFTIAQVEAGINFWRVQRPGPDSLTLAPEAAALATCYGEMIFRNQGSVASENLSLEQLEALRQALAGAI